MVGLASNILKKVSTIWQSSGTIRKEFLVDYLKAGFQKDISETIMNGMNMGYLPFLIKL